MCRGECTKTESCATISNSTLEILFGKCCVRKWMKRKTKTRNIFDNYRFHAYVMRSSFTCIFKGEQHNNTIYRACTRMHKRPTYKRNKTHLFLKSLKHTHTPKTTQSKLSIQIWKHACLARSLYLNWKRAQTIVCEKE